MDSVTLEDIGTQLMDTTSSFVNFQQQLLDVANYIDDIHYIGNIIFAAIGIPFNLILVGLIVSLKRLRHLPRNLSWIGIGLSNTFLIGAHLALVLSVRSESTASTRALCLWLCALCNTTQTFNILFALLERHVFITYPNWHKRFLTPTFIAVLQASSFMFLFLVFGLTNLPHFEEPFLAQIFSSWIFKLIGTVVIGILPICLAGQLTTMISRIRQDYPSSGENNIKLQPMIADTNKQQNDEEQADKNDKDDVNNSFFVRIGNNRISRLDLEAHRSIFFIGTMYFTFMVVIFVPFILVFVCIRRQVTTAAAECSSFIQVFYYCVNLLMCLQSGIANPLAFSLLSRDLMATFKTRSRRLIRRVEPITTKV